MNEELNKILEEVKTCAKCELSKTRTNAVPGAGSYTTKIMFIGEAPGFNEDQQGLPFVGRAGKILDELLESIGMARGEVFITNILKCRPPQNRNPQKGEIDACRNYLDRQVALIDPEVIAPLGSFAMTYIFEKYNLGVAKISEVRGKEFEVSTLTGKKKIIPLYHPAVATYNINRLGELKEDFKVLEKYK